MNRILLIVAFFWVTPLVAQEYSYPPEVGQRHPEFKLPSIENGKPISLSDYRGKKVILIHFASW